MEWKLLLPNRGTTPRHVRRESGCSDYAPVCRPASLETRRKFLVLFKKLIAWGVRRKTPKSRPLNVTVEEVPCHLYQTPVSQLMDILFRGCIVPSRPGRLNDDVEYAKLDEIATRLDEHRNRIDDVQPVMKQLFQLCNWMRLNSAASDGKSLSANFARTQSRTWSIKIHLPFEPFRSLADMREMPS